MASDEQPQRRIVYCRELDPDTVLHMTQFGDRYEMRRFDGTAPFEVHDAPRTSELRACYRFTVERELEPDEASHPVEDQEWWSERIARINAELLPRVEAQPSALAAAGRGFTPPPRGPGRAPRPRSGTAPDPGFRGGASHA